MKLFEKAKKKLGNVGAAIATLAVAILACFAAYYLFATPAWMIRKSTAVKALETQGFSNVEVVSKDLYFIRLKGGSKDDSVRFVCRATNPAGKRVEVHVFSSMLKSATVRSP